MAFKLSKKKGEFIPNKSFWNDVKKKTIIVFMKEVQTKRWSNHLKGKSKSEIREEEDILARDIYKSIRDEEFGKKLRV
jgi:hypothetical protein